jgi:hypothetical protein
MSFSLQGGEANLREPFLRVWPERNDVGALYGIVEVVAGPPRDVASIVWQGIDEGLRGSRFTLTRYLQNALQRGHQYLSEYAARGWRAGATLVSIKGQDMYLAWAGPSLVYLLADGDLVSPGSNTSKILGTGIPLGERGELAPHVAHEKIGEGDAVLMAWTRLKKVTTEPAISALLTTGVENCTQSIYRLVAGEQDFAALVASFDSSSTNDVT